MSLSTHVLDTANARPEAHSGNHLLTVTGGGEQLGELGRLVPWQGARDIAFENG